MHSTHAYCLKPGWPKSPLVGIHFLHGGIKTIIALPHLARQEIHRYPVTRRTVQLTARFNPCPGLS